MKDKFLLDDNTTFLNHGSFGACPRPVFEKYQFWQRELEKNPVDFTQRQLPSLLRFSRDRLAKFIGTDGGNLVFVSNATTGLNSIARSLNLNKGDEVLVSSHSYGAVTRTWSFLEEKSGVKVQTFNVPLPYTDDDFIENLTAALTEKTKVVCLDHITSMSALRFPLKKVTAILKERGIVSVIDGAHAPGQIDLNLNDLGADFYVGNLHKWLCMPKGSAFLWTAGDLEELDPLVVSWGWQSNDYYAFHGAHEWTGTRDHSSFLCIDEALSFRKKNNWETHQHRCRSLCLKFRDEYNSYFSTLKFVEDEGVHQMATVELPAGTHPKKFQDSLFDKYRIEVNCDTIEDRPVLRVSCQAYNDEEDIEKALTAIKEML